MLKVTNDKKQSSEIYITPVEGSKFIPLNLGGRLTNTANSVNDLGKYLLRASADGDVNEIRELLSEGAPFTSDWLGTSPLHLASKNNHVEVCEILLRAGISCNARTKVDRTPLHIAAYEGHLDIIRLLLAENAEINCTDLLEMTPLHWAVQQGNVDAVQALLKYGADKQLSNKFDLKPIDIAKQIDRSDIIMILEEEEQEDPLTATENLKIEMAAQDEENQKESVHNENYSTNNIEYKQEHQNYEENSISMKILQEHGITMLPNDDEDNNLLSSVMETGHSVVLTDVGKQVLDSVKASEEYNEDITRNLGKKNFITVTANEFLALAANATINKNRAQIFRQVDGKLVPKTIKKIVMKKNKIQTISQSTNVTTTKKKIYDHQSGVNKDAEVVKIAKRLAETKRTIDELKKKIIQKEAEAEIYRQQLNNLMEQS